jgi:hypothetical protein
VDGGALGAADFPGERRQPPAVAMTATPSAANNSHLVVSLEAKGKSV